MSNKEKMVAGRLYIASDPELVADRTAARKLVAEFNATTGRQAYLTGGRCAALHKSFISQDEGQLRVIPAYVSSINSTLCPLQCKQHTMHSASSSASGCYPCVAVREKATVTL